MCSITSEAQTKSNLSKNYVRKIEPIYIYDHYAKHIQK